MGCGRVGSSLARALERRGHSVSVIDINADSFRRLGPDFHGRTIKGVGFDKKVLVSAGIKQADGFAAVSSGDNSNILAARVVRETYGIDNVVARIYDQGRAEVYERLGIPSVATVRWAADQVLRRLVPEGSEPEWRDASGQVRLIRLGAHDGWVGRRVSDIEAAIRSKVPFVARFGQGIVPDGATLLQHGDTLFVAAGNDDVTRIEAVLAAPPPRH